MATRRSPQRKVGKQDPVRELERKYAAHVVFIDPKGVPHEPKEEISVGGETFNEPEGVRCYTHECFAASRLNRAGEQPSEKAWQAYASTGFDIGPYESELILRGWTRGRGCVFMLRKPDKNTLWSVALAARARRCPAVDTDTLSEDGIVRSKSYTTEGLIQTAEWAGLGKRSRRRR